MAKQTIEVMIEGGKATAAPPLGPALGPTGLNVSQVIAKINEKTANFKGMQVPVKVNFDAATKEFDIEVGTPPTSSLLTKEAGIEKGSGFARTDKVADLMIEQIIKVAKMKEDSLNGATLKEKVKNVIGTCRSMGILVEGKEPAEIIKDINAGKYDKEIAEEKTELTEEEKRALEEERQKLKEEIERRHAEEEKKANEIIASMAGKDKSVIKARLRENGISEALIAKLIAGIGGPAGAHGAAATSTGASAAKKTEAAPSKK